MVRNIRLDMMYGAFWPSCLGNGTGSGDWGSNPLYPTCSKMYTKVSMEVWQSWFIAEILKISVP